MTAPAIRAAAPREVPRLEAIERSANARFADIGMPEVAQIGVTGRPEWMAAIADGRAWVAADDANEAVAFVVASAVDGNAHIEQMSVLRAWQGRGLGTRLVERVMAWARERGLPATTLTTFVEVPWNAPYYRRLGFRAATDDEIGPSLGAMVAHNATTVLGRWPRVTMRRGT